MGRDGAMAECRAKSVILCNRENSQNSDVIIYLVSPLVIPMQNIQRTQMDFH